MKYVASVLIVVICISGVISAQEVFVTFKGIGESTKVDSVVVTNLSTDESLTLPGNETLILSASTRIPDLLGSQTTLQLFPNPFHNSTTLSINQSISEQVFIIVRNLNGQIVSHSERYLETGNHIFRLSLESPGIYLIDVIGQTQHKSIKAICSVKGEDVNRITYVGASDLMRNHPQKNLRNQFQSSYLLGYSPGDLIHYTGMSGPYTTIITDSTEVSQNYDFEFNNCVDPDGRSYRVIKIGEQRWMAENLAWLTKINPASHSSESLECYYVYGYEGSSVSEAKAYETYTTYGVLYNLEAALTACPFGWHLPRDEEWQTLEKHLGMSDVEADETGWRYTGSAGRKLKSNSGWNSNGNGDNLVGFNALPGGTYLQDGDFFGLNDYGFFATNSTLGSGDGFPLGTWIRYLGSNFDAISRSSTYITSGLSVRCVMDQGPVDSVVTTAGINSITESSAVGGGRINPGKDNVVTERGVCWSTSQYPTITDSKSVDGSGLGVFKSNLTGLDSNTVYYVRAYANTNLNPIYGPQVKFTTYSGSFIDSRDGHTYQYLKIGTQNWMAENLAYLPEVSTSDQGSRITPFYYVYKYQGQEVSAAKETANYTTYGVLYNWEAAQTACPEGWHLPSEYEWKTLSDYLKDNGYGYEGSGSDIGKSLASTSGWVTYDRTGSPGNDQPSNNSSGFTALPAGIRPYNGTFEKQRFITGFISSTTYFDDTNFAGFYLYNHFSSINKGFPSKENGFSVRCVKD